MEYVFLSNIIRKYIKGKSPDNNVFLFSKNDVEVSYLTPEYLRGIGSPIQVKNQKSFVWVEDGDIIILWDGSNAGEILKGKNGVLPSTMVKLLIFNDYYKEYVFYLLKFNEYKFKGKTQGSGIPHANKDEIERVKIYKIDFNEQSKIAEILMTIDDAIEKTERIIAKYSHIKQGLLQDLLTKGIDENGNIRSEATHKFKDSPLGRIPVEWEIKSFFDVCSVINGRAFKPEEWSEQGLPIVRIENLNNNNAKYNYCNFRVPNKYYIDNGELLLSWSGTPGTSFGVFIWNRGKAILNQHIFIVKIKHCIRKEFFYYYYNHVVLDEMIRQSHGGVGLQHVTKEDLKRINFVVPKIEEQERVIQIAKTIDDSIETEKKYLSKLKSIKQGLMQDLLTGKVRVTHLLDKGGKSDECHP